MSDEFKEESIDIKPELTFQPFQDEVLNVKEKEEKIEKEIIDEVQLTEEEKKWLINL